MKLASVLFMVLALAMLIRRNLLQVDLSFPWFLSLVLLALASTSEGFIGWVAGVFGIVNDALVVILISMGLFLGIITTLSVALSRVRQRQIRIVRQLALQDLAAKQLNRDHALVPPRFAGE